jgi:methionine-rich copper-binding protein CopC
MPLRKTAQTTLAILVAGFMGGMAHAHPALETTVPGQGATVTSPKEIRLTFTEDLVAKFSGLTVKDQTGQLVETAGPSVDPNRKRQLSAWDYERTSRLSPRHIGSRWRAVLVGWSITFLPRKECTCSP